MNKIAIGAILLVFIGGIIALILILSSSSSPTSSPTTSSSSPTSGPTTTSTPNGTLPNDCNKRPGETKTYKLAYTSLKDKTTPKHGWAAGGNEDVICYYDKEATKQVSGDDCSNYYAVGGGSADGSAGFKCYNNTAGRAGCIVDINPADQMNGKNSCPNDWKNSGWSNI